MHISINMLANGCRKEICSFWLDQGIGSQSFCGDFCRLFIFLVSCLCLGIFIDVNTLLFCGPLLFLGKLVWALYALTFCSMQFSLPLPQGGRDAIAKNLILREDQLPQKFLYPKTKKKTNKEVGCLYICWHILKDVF